MEFESVRSERDANEEYSPFFRGVPTLESFFLFCTTNKKRKRKKLERTLLSSFEIGFDHIFVRKYR
jgi:hypothetical protein